MSLPKPTAILFDWDNTLVDTWPTIHAALNEMMHIMGEEEWSLEKVQANVKKSMRDSFPAMFGDRADEAAKHYQTAYRRMHLENLQPLPGALELVQSLQGLPLFKAIVSNKRGDTLRKELTHLGWEHYFDAAIGSGDAEYDKPHPEMIYYALRHSDLPTGEHVWFIGDTVVDLEAATAAGCTPILYGDVKTDAGIYLGHAFSCHVRDHEALMDIVIKYQ